MSLDRDAAKRRAEFEQMKRHPGISLRTKIRLGVLGVVLVLTMIGMATQSEAMAGPVIISVLAGGLIWRFAARL